MSPAGATLAASDGSPDDVLFDTPLARLAIGSAGTIDRFITRTQGQVALSVTVARLVGHKVGLPVSSPSFDPLDEPRIHPVRTMARVSNVAPLRPSDRLSATTGADELPVVVERPAKAGTTPDAGTTNDAGADEHPPDDAASDHAGTADALAIPGYDELAASQVVKRLDGLNQGELAAIEAYERNQRGRRTILGRIGQLQSGR
jgi:hypothetical protein